MLPDQSVQKLINGASMARNGIAFVQDVIAEFQSSRSGMSEYAQAQTLELIRRVAHDLPVDVP